MQITDWLTALGVGGLSGELLAWLLQERRRRRDERATITGALLTEIVLVQESILRRHGWWTQQTAPTPPLPALVPFATDVYDHVVERIGVLPAELTREIVRFHGYIKFINEFQETLQDCRSCDRDAKNSQKEVGFYSKYHHVLDKQILRYREQAAIAAQIELHHVAPVDMAAVAKEYPGPMSAQATGECAIK